jgi:hypothetical protein
VFSGLYELPFGRGKLVAGGAGGIANAIIGGWQLATTTILQTGTPFTVGGGAGRPNRICDGAVPRGERSVERWFDASCFVLPDPVPDTVFGGTYIPYGNSGPNILASPGLVNEDLSLFKSFVIGENKRIEFRCEAFNLLNTPHFSPPSSGVPDSNAGRIFSTVGDPRQVQLVLKVSF